MLKLTSRLLLSMLYLGVLLFAGGYVLQWAQSFEGILIVEKGRTEQWTVRTSDEQSGLFSAQRNMPVDVIGFDNPRAATRVLGTKGQFDAAILPFRLKLEDVEVLERHPDKETLEVIRTGKTTKATVKPGQSLSLPEGQVTMIGIEPWRGLIRDGSGEPMAAVSLKSGDDPWSPVLFADTKSVIRPLPGLAVSLHWFPEEDAARAPVSESQVTTRQTRWGIHDIGRTHWFEALTPGTGVTTSDGTQYTLVEVQENSDAALPPVAAIVLQKVSGGKASPLRIEANAAAADSEAILESYNDRNIVRLHAWRDGTVVVHETNEGKPGEVRRLNEGEHTEIQGTTPPLQLRLEQVMRTAIPVSGEDARMLVLQTADDEIRLREGQSVQLKESRLRFRRMPQPPTVQYTLQVLHKEKEEENQEFVLAPGASKRIGQWRFTHDVEHGDSETIAVLNVKRLPGTPTQYFGLALFILGALGLTVFRFAGWHAVGHEDATTIFEEDKWTAVPPEEKED